MLPALWGEFSEEEQENESIKIINNMIPNHVKKEKLAEIEARHPLEKDNHTTIKIKSPLVTQTIEVMKQTEMLQSLIDTYSNKSGSSNYLLNPCQMIPEVDFPPENVADFIRNSKFAKPIWFVPPQDTPFSRGVPKAYPEINTEICRKAFRKAACGQLRMAGFTDATDSALVLISDATEEFMRTLMGHLSLIQRQKNSDKNFREVEMDHLEKAYYKMTHTSLLDVHNFYKHNVVERNRSGIAEFKSVLEDYDKLMKESQCMQKEEFQGDFLNILEMPQSNETSNGTTMPDIDGQPQHLLGTFKDAFNSKTPETEASNAENQLAGGFNTYATESLL